MKMSQLHLEELNYTRASNRSTYKFISRVAADKPLLHYKVHDANATEGN